MKWRAVEFEYKIRNKINYNFSPREARRIRFVFLSLSKNCAVRNLEKGYFPFFSPKISTSSLLVWLCWAGGGNNATWGWLSINWTGSGWPTDSGLTLAAPPRWMIDVFFMEQQRLSKITQVNTFLLFSGLAVFLLGGGTQVWTGQLLLTRPELIT